MAEVARQEGVREPVYCSNPGKQCPQCQACFVPGSTGRLDTQLLVGYLAPQD